MAPINSESCERAFRFWPPRVTMWRLLANRFDGLERVFPHRRDAAQVTAVHRGVTLIINACVMRNLGRPRGSGLY
jgi:hypothetical protein